MIWQAQDPTSHNQMRGSKGLIKVFSRDIRQRSWVDHCFDFCDGCEEFIKGEMCSCDKLSQTFCGLDEPFESTFPPGSTFYVELPGTSQPRQILLNSVVLEHSLDVFRDCLKSFPVVRYKLTGQTSSGSKPLQTPQEWVSGHVCHDVQVYCPCY